MISNKENKESYLVLLDFSEVSYAALKYVVSVARITGKKIHLLHIIDVNELIKGDNHIAELRAIKLEVRRVENKLKSIIEIISAEGVEADSHYSMGSISSELTEQIALLEPELVVVGKKTNKSIFSSEVIRFLLNDFAGPILLVNKCVPFNKETKLAFGFNLSQSYKYNPAILFELNNSTTHPLSLVSVMEGDESNYKTDLAVIWESYLNNNATVRFDYPEATSVGDCLKQHVLDEEVELLCIGRGDYKGSFWNRLFNKKTILNEIVNKVNIPVIILKKQKK